MLLSIIYPMLIRTHPTPTTPYTMIKKLIPVAFCLLCLSFSPLMAQEEGTDTSKEFVDFVEAVENDVEMAAVRSWNEVEETYNELSRDMSEEYREMDMKEREEMMRYQRRYKDAEMKWRDQHDNLGEDMEDFKNNFTAFIDMVEYDVENELVEDWEMYEDRFERYENRMERNWNNYSESVQHEMEELEERWEDAEDRFD